MTKDGNPNLALRIQVESGGCHGFQYLMSLVTIPAKDSPEWSEVVREDDTIFQFTPDEADAQSPRPQNAPRIILDEPSLDLLKGSKVDFTMELIGSQFKIVDNPYATSSCGCGTSFDIKM
jgi:iron-sulfur cluster assembly accessory protein